MKRSLCSALVAALTMTLIGVGGPVRAESNDGPTRPDVSGPGSSASPAEKRQTAAKLSVAEAYYAAKYGNGSADALQQAAADYQSAYPRSADGSFGQLATRAGSRAAVRRGS